MQRAIKENSTKVKENNFTSRNPEADKSAKWNAVATNRDHSTNRAGKNLKHGNHQDSRQLLKPSASGYFKTLKLHKTPRKHKNYQFCGKSHIWGKERCSAYGHKCTICLKHGHFESHLIDFRGR